MFKKRFARIIQLITGQRGSDGEDLLTLETGLTWLEKFVHFWVMVTQSFIRNRCPIRASALSYSSLLALIPMMAVALSVTSSLLKDEGEDKIYEFIDEVVARMIQPASVPTDKFPRTTHFNTPQDDTPKPAPADVTTTNDSVSVTETNNIAETDGIATPLDTSTNALSSTDPQVIAAQKDAAHYVHQFIQNSQSGKLGVTGMVLLVSVAIVMLSRVEETFNDIWGVTQGRNWLMRVVQYWAVITLGPVLLASALALWGGSQFQSTKDIVGGTMGGQFLFQLLPLVLLWLTFATLYKMVPNTKVNVSAALVGGAFAGTLWLVNNLFGFLYVSRVVTNSKIYGSLGLVPVFMAGLYLSWLILLLGAQVAYAFQNRAAFLQDRLAENVNQRGREFVALRLMTCIGQRFQRGLAPPTISQISDELGVPSRLAQQVLQILIAARLVVEVTRGEATYAPARPLETINAHHVLMAMRSTGGKDLVTRDEPVRVEVYGEFARIQEAEKNAATAITMLALVNRVQSKVELLPPVDERKPAKLVGAFASSPIETEAAQGGQQHTKTHDFPSAVQTETTATVAPEVQFPLAGKSAAGKAPKKKTTSNQQGISTSQSARASATDDNESFPL